VSESIEIALRMIGVRCSVERRGTLAILTLAEGERALERPDVRRETLAILRAYGFTHAAVEPAEGANDDSSLATRGDFDA
jgi:hypothetical protein